MAAVLSVVVPSSYFTYALLTNNKSNHGDDKVPIKNYPPANATLTNCTPATAAFIEFLVFRLIHRYFVDWIIDHFVDSTEHRTHFQFIIYDM